MKTLTVEELELFPKALLTPQQVCNIMGISQTTFYRNIEKMPFPVLRFGTHYKIPKAAFIDFIRTGKGVSE